METWDCWLFLKNLISQCCGLDRMKSHSPPLHWGEGKSLRDRYLWNLWGEINAKTICVSTKHSRWVRKSFCSYLTTFIYWALFCLQDTELQFQRKRKKNLIKKAEYFGGLSLAVLVDYAASKCTPTRSISVNAYYSSDNTSAIFWELSEILK